ncbi:response regulator [Saccharophagus sp. K07]|uniref:response regulator n=1 Tax=Saccharophagus sp. K07 TaxID=2283636 RepID=UPI0016529008|nr:response regulator [Saccharophagus sp. K07]MBC6905539.1 response regulator [Saccharophagus sp. K07]
MSAYEKSPPSIILVEDDHSLARVWKTLFEMLDYKISCFHTGLDLLRHAHEIGNYDIVITDYYLPDINGVELIKEIREHAPSIPAIVLTGSHEEFIKDAVKKVSGCHILYKPLNMADIEEKLAEIFSHTSE